MSAKPLHRDTLPQVDGGDAGWLDFSEDASDTVEAAYLKVIEVSAADSAAFTGHGGSAYTVDFNFMAQTNVASRYVRPVRRVPK